MWSPTVRRGLARRLDFSVCFRRRHPFPSAWQWLPPSLLFRRPATSLVRLHTVLLAPLHTTRHAGPALATAFRLLPRPLFASLAALVFHLFRNRGSLRCRQFTHFLCCTPGSVALRPWVPWEVRSTTPGELSRLGMSERRRTLRRGASAELLFPLTAKLQMKDRLLAVRLRFPRLLRSYPLLRRLLRPRLSFPVSVHLHGRDFPTLSRTEQRRSLHSCLLVGRGNPRDWSLPTQRWAPPVRFPQLSTSLC